MPHLRFLPLAAETRYLELSPEEQFAVVLSDGRVATAVGAQTRGLNVIGWQVIPEADDPAGACGFYVAPADLTRLPEPDPRAPIVSYSPSLDGKGLWLVLVPALGSDGQPCGPTRLHSSHSTRPQAMLAWVALLRVA